MKNNYARLPPSTAIQEIYYKFVYYFLNKNSANMRQNYEVSNTKQNPQGKRTKQKLSGLSLRENYTDRATAAFRQSYCQLCG
jgi:hypothetical protein